jgi:uncharacterized damage-inducible protein DinB
MLFQAATNTLFNRIEALLVQISPEEYQRAIPVLGAQAIGQHIRHILEFYGCLLQACQSGVVNYDLRPRDKSLEQQPEVAMRRLHAVEVGFLSFTEDMPLQLQTTFGQQALICRDVHTTLEREVVYLAEHTIHHLALVAIGLRAALPHIQIPSNLGVAESTIRAREAALAGVRQGD